MPDTPIEWVEQLAGTLTNRQAPLARYERYYRGKHPLAFATSEYRQEFGRLLEGYADNWTRLIVDAIRERLFVVGFRFGITDDAEDGQNEADQDEVADRETWGIWQANKLDARHQQAITTALVCSVAYGLVWPPRGSTITEAADGSLTVDMQGRPPRITFEHPRQMLVAHDPADRDVRLAAVKVWRDYDKHQRATVYLPDRVVRFRADRPSSDMGNFDLKRLRPIETVENPFGVVPVVPIENRPDLYGEPESEIADVIPNQDAINKLASDMLVASEYGAFVQRLLTGVEAPKDPETNEVIAGWDHAALKKRILTVAAPDARGVSFPATDLRNFVTALDNRVNSIASQTRTPPHYLNASADRLSGESIKAAESGLVAKAREKQLHFGEQFEELMRLAHLVRGDFERARAVDAETLWRDPETRTEGEHVDAVIKKRKALPLSWEGAMEDLNYSPTAIDRERRRIHRESLEFGFGADLDAEDLGESA